MEVEIEITVSEMIRYIVIDQGISKRELSCFLSLPLPRLNEFLEQGKYNTCDPAVVKLRRLYDRMRMHGMYTDRT